VVHRPAGLRPAAGGRGRRVAAGGRGRRVAAGGRGRRVAGGRRRGRSGGRSPGRCNGDRHRRRRRCRTDLWCSRGHAVQNLLHWLTFCTTAAAVHQRSVLHRRSPCTPARAGLRFRPPIAMYRPPALPSCTDDRPALVHRPPVPRAPPTCTASPPSPAPQTHTRPAQDQARWRRYSDVAGQARSRAPAAKRWRPDHSPWCP
jgi:hypothetical protein